MKTFEKKLPFQLLLGAVLSFIGWLTIAALGDVRAQTSLFFVIYGGVFVVYFFLALQIVSTNNSAPEKSRPGHKTQVFLLIFIPAILCRFVLLWDYPYLSDDIFRYMWDGRVWANGVNPYMFAPNDAALAAIRDAVIFPNVNHAEIPTIYAPVLQVIFRITYEISPTMTAFKIVMTVFDLAIIIALIQLLKALNLPPLLAFIYAWNPLVIIETAGGGHIDSVGVFFLVLFFIALTKQRFWQSLIFLALATLTKFVALIMLPFIWLRLGWKKATIYTLILGALLFLAYLPFLDAGETLYKALTEYTTRWKFNASLFELPFHFFSWLYPHAYEDQVLYKTKVFLGCGFGALFLWLLFDADKSKESWSKYWFVLFATICAVSPTLHPWYLIWLTPFLAIFPNRAWILLTGLVILSYRVIEDYFLEGVWQESLLVRLLIFAPFYGLLFYDFWKTKGRDLKVETMREATVDFPKRAWGEVEKFFSSYKRNSSDA